MNELAKRGHEATMVLRSYRKLEVWMVTMEPVELIYRMTATMPVDERHGLRSQIQRSAVSIPANIAEGCGRGTRADYRHYLVVARCSLIEPETHLTIAARVKLVRRDDAMGCWKLAQRVWQMLTRLIKSLESEPRNPPLIP